MLQRLALSVPTIVGLTVLVFFLLCILSWPATWLVQYSWSMGPTPRRIAGLAYATGGVAFMIALMAWTIRRGRVRQSPQTAGPQ